MIRVWFLTRRSGFLFSRVFILALGPTDYCENGIEGPSPRIRQPGHEGASTLPYVFMVWCLIKDREITAFDLFCCIMSPKAVSVFSLCSLLYEERGCEHVCVSVYPLLAMNWLILMKTRVKLLMYKVTHKQCCHTMHSYHCHYIFFVMNNEFSFMDRSSQPEHDLRWFIWKEWGSDLPQGENNQDQQQKRGEIVCYILDGNMVHKWIFLTYTDENWFILPYVLLWWTWSWKLITI